MTHRATVEWAAGLPESIQSGLATVSEFGLLALMGLFGLAALHPWHRPVADRSTAAGPVVAAGVGVVLAYLTSEAVKLLVSEVRPCHNFADATIASCPSSVDWSWPSNHATIAAALATGILAMSTRLGLLAIAVATAIGVSRVVVGVHYFHDIVAGALLGAVIVQVCVRWGSPLAARGLAAVAARL